MNHGKYRLAIPLALLIPLLIFTFGSADAQTACGSCPEGSCTNCDGTLKSCGRWTAVADANWPTNSPEGTKGHAVHLVLTRTRSHAIAQRVTSCAAGGALRSGARSR